MKRAILIAGGTVGGLGAVLSITPPQFGSSSLGGSTTTTTTTKATSTATQAATPAATPAATKKATATATKKATTTATKAATPAAATKPSGTFVGRVANTRFGPVQVQITVSNGKITSAKALQTPQNDFRSAEISRQAIPYLIEETLAANSANIQGVGGASYTSQGWYDSLVSALAKAGM
jgi:uncharacterized protein with FMN-binding domain